MVGEEGGRDRQHTEHFLSSEIILYDTSVGGLVLLPTQFCWTSKTFVDLKNKVYLKLILRKMGFQTSHQDESQAPQDLWRLVELRLGLSVPSNPAPRAGTMPVFTKEATWAHSRLRLSLFSLGPQWGSRQSSIVWNRLATSVVWGWQLCDKMPFGSEKQWQCWIVPMGILCSLGCRNHTEPKGTA